jgi:hypothetical protein
MQSYRPGIQKCCADCNCWLGARGLNSEQTEAQLESSTVKGKCGKSRESNRTETLAWQSCGKWEKWGVLKA